MNVLAPNALMAMTIWMYCHGMSYEEKIKFATFIREEAQRKHITLAQQAVSLWEIENRPLLCKTLTLEDQDFEVQECFKAWRQSFI